MSMFLTTQQIRELTGYAKPSMQRAWLEKNGIPHQVNAAGRPVVMVATLEHVNGIRHKAAEGGLIDWQKVA